MRRSTSTRKSSTPLPWRSSRTPRRARCASRPAGQAWIHTALQCKGGHTPPPRHRRRQRHAHRGTMTRAACAVVVPATHARRACCCRCSCTWRAPTTTATTCAPPASACCAPSTSRPPTTSSGSTQRSPCRCAPRPGPTPGCLCSGVPPRARCTAVAGACASTPCLAVFPSPPSGPPHPPCPPRGPPTRAGILGAHLPQEARAGRPHHAGRLRERKVAARVRRALL